MSYLKQEIALPGMGPGIAPRLITHTFGNPHSGKSAYIQAGLHGDEHPGLLVIQHLLLLLKQLDQQGAIAGSITLVPYANPIGMAQRVFGPVVGRFDLENGENFNRNFPQLSDAVREHLNAGKGEGMTTRDWKAFFQQQLDQQLPPRHVTGAMKLELSRLAMAHDIMLDLHCDTDAIAHLYSSRLQSTRACNLANQLGSPVVLVEELDAGGGSFDQMHANAWGVLQAAGLFSAENAGFAATVELRGQIDISDELAQSDAEAILDFLTQESVLNHEGGSGRPRPHGAAQVYPLEAAVHIPCPCSGVIVYLKDPGQQVEKGEVIAEIVTIDGELFNERVPVHSEVDGVLVVRQLHRLVRPGQRAAFVAGHTPPAERRPGKLLLDF
ncbi:MULTISPECIES: succinylglutamate desuccinylase/aspartoacylase domain-containing protein [Silvimonas]|uniref:succinylglutamate desuccinylase/aspartoacylase domain-containing protein n=1 Tax=Silvimonas TaxID=300264 RepID=UPI0024B36900|nr:MULTISPECIES: succinylglutamate desuccinylase/aspartoacylase family protein [Silvimonas]MDR3426135.1 succinylglutamate desuccinylase/aspartoacylase family protein [Silvimonas sp.]